MVATHPYFFNVHPENWGNDPILTSAYLSNGLVQPPTRNPAFRIDLHPLQTSPGKISDPKELHTLAMSLDADGSGEIVTWRGRGKRGCPRFPVVCGDPNLNLHGHHYWEGMGRGITPTYGSLRLLGGSSQDF